MRQRRAARWITFGITFALALLAAMASPALAQKRRPTPPPAPSAPSAEEAAAAAKAAEERAAKEKASALLVEGNALLDQGLFVDALAKFQAAYAVFPSPKLHFNIAQTSHELGRPLDALEHYEAFLAGVKKEDMASQWELANQRVFRLQGEIAALTVQCNSAGAAVSVDGKPAGETPLAAPLRLLPGRHVVLVDKPGFERRVLEIELAAGTTKTERVELLTSAEALAQRQEFQRAEAARQAAEQRLRAEQRAAAAASSKRLRTWRTAGWISLGIGAAAAATALTTGGLALYEGGQVEDAVPGTSWSKEVQGHYDREQTYRGAFYVSSAVAVVGLATGGGLLLYARSKQSPAPVERAALLPVAIPGGGAAVVFGSF